MWRRPYSSVTLLDDLDYYWLRVFRLIGLACKVLGLLLLVRSPEPIYGPFSLGAKKMSNGRAFRRN
jgi:hypothetical protein